LWLGALVAELIPEILYAAPRGKGPGGPEFVKLIETNECFETLGSVSVPTGGFEYRMSNKEFRTIFFTSMFCGSLFCGSAVQNNTLGSVYVPTEKLKN
jgi:hypothetical protein